MKRATLERLAAVLVLAACICAECMMRKFEQPDEMGAYDRWELKLQKKTAALVKEWADLLLFANYTPPRSTTPMCSMSTTG